MAKREPASELVDRKARSRRRRTRWSPGERHWGRRPNGTHGRKGCPWRWRAPAMPVEVIEPWTLNVARSLRDCCLVVGGPNSAQISSANPRSDRLIKARISCCRSVGRTTVTRPIHLRGAGRKGIVTLPPLSSISGRGSRFTILSVPRAHSSTCHIDRSFVDQLSPATRTASPDSTRTAAYRSASHPCCHRTPPLPPSCRPSDGDYEGWCAKSIPYNPPWHYRRNDLEVVPAGRWELLRKSGNPSPCNGT